MPQPEERACKALQDRNYVFGVLTKANDSGPCVGQCFVHPDSPLKVDFPADLDINTLGINCPKCPDSMLASLPDNLHRAWTLLLSAKHGFSAWAEPSQAS